MIFDIIFCNSDSSSKLTGEGKNLLDVSDSGSINRQAQFVADFFFRMKKNSFGTYSCLGNPGKTNYDFGVVLESFLMAM